MFFMLAYPQKKPRNVISPSLFTKLPWPGDCEGSFRSSSQAATCPSVYTRWRHHTVLLLLNVKLEAVNTNFYSLWFYPTGIRTRVYRFSSRRFMHSSTNWSLSLATLTLVS